MRSMVLVVLLLIGATAIAQPTTGRGELLLDLPVVDVPFNVSPRLAAPSMRQSLTITADISRLAHVYLHRAVEGTNTPTVWWKIASAEASDLAADVLLGFLPGGYQWMHEEWHRAVLSARGISSFDDVYRFELGANTAVSGVNDEALVRLKAEHPQDFIRLAEAGNEAQLEFGRYLIDDAFFSRRRIGPHVVTLWLSRLTVLLYDAACTSSSIDDSIDQANAREAAPASRDALGPDCTAWAYDLMTVGHPYSERGVHPSGVGIDRYRKLGLLPAEGQRLLRQVRNLDLLNFISPALFGISRFKVTDPIWGNELAWNFDVLHETTSFGQIISVAVRAQELGWNLGLTVQNGFNARRYFPGLELELIRASLGGAASSVEVSARVAGWLQPRNGLYFESHVSAGGAAAVRGDVGVAPHVGIYLEANAKTAGWLAGNVYLDPAIQLVSGITWSVF